MSKVFIQMSMSLDGIAGGRDEAEFWAVHGPVLGWVVGLQSWRRRIGFGGGADTPDSRLVEADTARAGAHVMGRGMFDFGVEPWGETPPFGKPVFVVTSREREPLERLGGTTFTFVTGGVAEAVQQAKAAAGDADVMISGGVALARAALAAGVIDELVLHVAPVIIGDGLRLFDELGLATQQLALTNTRTVAGDGITHLSYDVAGLVTPASGPPSFDA